MHAILCYILEYNWYSAIFSKAEWQEWQNVKDGPLVHSHSNTNQSHEGDQSFIVS